MPSSDTFDDIESLTGYEKLLEQESHDFSRPEEKRRPISSQCGFLTYRTAFWVLALLYVVTISFSITTWSTEEVEIVRSYGIVDIPIDDKIIFKSDLDFQRPPDQLNGEDPWERLEPMGRGFIEVPVDIDLGNGNVKEEKQYYCISMFHQLHCIASLKAAFNGMNNESQSNNNHGNHLNHCFDYLRQAVMCAGDMTLEPARILNDHEKGVDGWNVEHRCRNFQTMIDFAEQHTYSNSSGIL